MILRYLSGKKSALGVARVLLSFSTHVAAMVLTEGWRQIARVTWPGVNIHAAVSRRRQLRADAPART
jgi:hypothetical protein